MGREWEDTSDNKEGDIDLTGLKNMADQLRAGHAWALVIDGLVPLHNLYAVDKVEDSSLE